MKTLSILNYIEKSKLEKQYTKISQILELLFFPWERGVKQVKINLKMVVLVNRYQISIALNN